MAASNRSGRRRRVERGIYEPPNGSYAVCVMLDGRPRFRTLGALTITEARRQRELLQSLARVGELPVSPRLTFAEAAARWLRDFEAKVTAGDRRERTLDLYCSQVHQHLLPRLGRRRLALSTADDVVAVSREAAGGRALALDDQAHPRRAQLRVHVYASPHVLHALDRHALDASDTTAPATASLGSRSAGANAPPIGLKRTAMSCSAQSGHSWVREPMEDAR
jgi:hypothetical protein